MIGWRERDESKRSDGVLQCCLGWKGTGCSGGFQEKSVHTAELKAADSWEREWRRIGGDKKALKYRINKIAQHDDTFLCKSYWLLCGQDRDSEWLSSTLRSPDGRKLSEIQKTKRSMLFSCFFFDFAAFTVKSISHGEKANKWRTKHILHFI